MIHRHISVLLCAVLLCGNLGGCSRRILGADDSAYSPHRSNPAPVRRGDKIDAGKSLALITGVTFAALATSGTDSKISSYAMDNTPVFGSNENAKRASDILAVMSAAVAATLYVIKYFPVRGSIADPPVGIIHISEYHPAHIHLSPIEAVEAGALSYLLTTPTTDLMKSFVGRERPDKGDYASFPSGHTTISAWANAYSANIVNAMHLRPAYHYTTHGALTLMTLGTAWGRVEGGRHYPSDVLAGLMIGVCLTDAAFIFFTDNPKHADYGFNIGFANRRDVMTTTITTTVEF